MEKSKATNDMKIRMFQALCILILLSSCSRGYEPIDYGKDPCTHCKMTIVDDRFAAEFVNTKGKAFKFDDVVCMKQYMTKQKTDNGSLLFVEDYLKKQEGAIDAKTAFYLKHDFFPSPMNGDYAAFATEADAKQLGDSLKIQIIKWADL
jgi:copper chaperone NosL